MIRVSRSDRQRIVAEVLFLDSQSARKAALLDDAFFGAERIAVALASSLGGECRVHLVNTTHGFPGHSWKQKS